MAAQEIFFFLNRGAASYKQNQAQWLKMFFILMLAFADFCFSSIFFLAFVMPNTISWCRIEAFLFESFRLASVLWTFANCLFWFMESVSLRSKELVIQSKEVQKVKLLFGLSICGCWGFPIVAMAFFQINPQYFEIDEKGVDLPWCSISDKSGQWIAFSFTPLALVWFTNLLFFFLHLYLTPKDKRQDKEVRILNWWFGGYVLGFTLVWTPHMIDRMLRMRHIQSFDLLVIHTFTEPLQGFLNAVVYTLIRCMLPRPSEEVYVLHNRKVISYRESAPLLPVQPMNVPQTNDN